MAPSDPPNVHRFRPREATDSVVVDPALAEMVKQGILKAREKLIDLSMRNGMQEELSQRLVVLASDGVTDADELRRQALASFPLA